jgi:acetoin utilization protein AcuA
MAAQKTNSIAFPTSKGQVVISVEDDTRFLDSLVIDEGIGAFPNYRSMLWDKKHIIRLIDQFKGRIVVAQSEERKMIGYIAFSHPIEAEGWPQELIPILYELGSIEVSRNWRRMGISKKLLETAMADDSMNDFVVILSGLSWHWDLDGTELSKREYRKMLIELFASVGFRHYYTNEPNVLMDAANMLMARVGERVSKEDQDRFLEALFSFKP